MESAAPLRNIQWVQGNSVDITPGNVFVVEFWATWCPPCRTAIPHLSALAQKYQGQATFVGLTNETDQNKVQNFVRSMGSQMQYNVGIDRGNVSNAYMSRYNVQGIPHAFLVDHNSKVVWHGHPMDPEFEPHLQKYISASALSAKKWTKDELEALPVKQLKDILVQRNTSFVGLVEKHELVDKILSTM